MLAVVVIRYDEDGKPFLALLGQTDEEAKEMNRLAMEAQSKAAAKIFEAAFYKAEGVEPSDR